MMDLSNIQFNTDSLSASGQQREEILQCVRNIILTPAGTIPLYRDFGLDMESFIGMPVEAVENLLAVEIMDKVAVFEPRVTIPEVQVRSDQQGQTIVKVVIADA